MTRRREPLKQPNQLANWFVNNFSDFDSIEVNSASFTTFGGGTRMNLLCRKNKYEYTLRVFYRRTFNRKNEEIVICNYLDDDLFSLFDKYLKFNDGLDYNEVLEVAEKLNRLTDKEYLFFINDYLIKKNFNIQALDDFLADKKKIMKERTRRTPSKDFEKKFEFQGIPVTANSITPHAYFWPKEETKKIPEPQEKSTPKAEAVSEKDKLELEILEMECDLAQKKIEILKKRLSLMN